MATAEGSPAIDLDAVPVDGVSIPQALSFLLGPNAAALRSSFLVLEAASAADILLRRAARRAFRSALSQFSFLIPPTVPAPLPSGPAGRTPTVALVEPNEAVDAAFPELSEAEELYAKALIDLAGENLGNEAAGLLDDPNPTAFWQLAARAGRSGSLIPPQFAGVNTMMQFVAVPSGASDDDDDDSRVEGLIAALGGLSQEEEEVLQGCGREVADRVLARLAERVRPLL